MNEKGKKYVREYIKRRYATDQEFKRKWDERTNRWRNSVKGKAFVKEYNARAEVKKRVKDWFAAHPHYHRDRARKQKLLIGKIENGN